MKKFSKYVIFLLVVIFCSLFIGCNASTSEKQEVYEFQFEYNYGENNTIKLLSVSYNNDIVELKLELKTLQYDFEDYEFSLRFNGEIISFDQNLTRKKNDKTLHGKGNFEEIIIAFYSEKFKVYQDSTFLLNSLIYINPTKNVSIAPLRYFRIAQNDLI